MHYLHLLWMTYMELAPYLLFGLAITGLLHVAFPKRLIIKHMGGNRIGAVIKAALLGVPMPLCSCGVIPTALHLRKNGASRGATLSFLVSTPQTGIDSIVPTYGMLGPVFAIYRPLVAFIMGITGGAIANKVFPPDAPVVNEDKGFHCDLCDNPVPHRHSWISRAYIGGRYAFRDFLDDISIQLVFGILLAALITWLIPDRFFLKYGGNGFLGMVLMMLIGIPLYVCATASIPIAVSLMLKGISPGAAFVFLVCGPATNAATIALIGNALGKKFVSFYLAVIGILALIFGLLLNAIYQWIGIDPLASLMLKIHDMSAMSPLSWTWIILFSVFLIASLSRKVLERIKPSQRSIAMSDRMFHVEGMSCNHCVRHVENAVREIPGVTMVEVNLAGKSALVKGDFDPAKVIEVVDQAGYKATEERA
jgi:uncharacterized membrane protein YraQ (UPF0718 family)/copper chaperone CopZ